MRNIVLCPADLAIIARDLLIKNGGFTIDEYGHSAEGDFWAVAVEGKEHRCTMFGAPPLEEFEKYLLKYPISGSGEYFGGYVITGDVLLTTRCVFDHALLFAQKHTAVQEGLRQKQDSIYNLETRELLELKEFRVPCDVPADCADQFRQEYAEKMIDDCNPRALEELDGWKHPRRLAEQQAKPVEPCDHPRHRFASATDCPECGAEF